MRLLTLFGLLAGCSGVPVTDLPARDTGPEDLDGDGYTGADDCDEGSESVYVGAPEECNARDDDCDGAVDEDATDAAAWFADIDGDRYGDPASLQLSCTILANHVLDSTDCDDGDPTIRPGAPESCDHVDNNCDGSVDEGCDTTVYATVWGSRMVRVHPGTFTMGGGEGDPSDVWLDHDVTITRAFWLGQHELTQAQWAEWTHAADTTPSLFEGADLPVEQVPWYAAALYANALSEAEGRAPCYTASGEEMVPEYAADPYGCPGYRLPTEAEWEYAARAGEDTRYAGSDTLGTVGWFRDNSGKVTHPGCGLDANAWGFCDMSGNVQEWTNDWAETDYGGYGTGLADIDPPGPASSSIHQRIFRDGCYLCITSQTYVADRHGRHSDIGDRTLGFRLARTE